jgi:hypothetical protein
MRLLLLCFLLSFALSPAAAQVKKQNADSKIETVTVFLQGAQVNRSSKITLLPGKYELAFTGISPDIDKQSIQAKAEGQLTILSVMHQRNFLKEQKAQEEIELLQNAQQSVSDKINIEINTQKVYQKEENILDNNMQVSGNNTGLKTVDLKEAADFQRLRRIELYAKMLELEKNIKKLQAEYQKISKQLTELNQKKNMATSEIIVTALVKENTNASFNISYLVQNAGWYPAYDLRATDINSPINLQYKANVFQSSGEDWKDIRLSLSTGNPGDNGIKPTIMPWYLGYANPVSNNNGAVIRDLSNHLGGNMVSGRVIDQNSGEALPGVTVRIKGTTIATSTAADGSFKLNTNEPSPILSLSYVGFNNYEVMVARGSVTSIPMRQAVNTLSEVVVTASRSSNRENDSYKQEDKYIPLQTTTLYQATTVVYEIELPFTVLNDGKTYTAEIQNFEMKALYEYYAAPKLAPQVFLTAKIPDWKDLNLQAGEVNLFFEGTYLGKSVLDVQNAGDTLNISLGRDKGVVIKRSMLKEFSQRKFLSNNKTDTRQYEILVRNNKSQPINIIIEDQLPISTQKEIEIDNVKYEGASLDKDTQKLSWLLTVEGKKEVKTGFKYSVKYPKDRNLALD